MGQMAQALQRAGVTAVKQTFGQVLSTERVALNATWQQVANNVGANKKDVKAWEDDEASPDARQLRKLFAMFKRLKMLTIDAGIMPPTVPKTRIITPREEPTIAVTERVSTQVVISPKPPAHQPKTTVSVEGRSEPSAPTSPVIVQTKSADQYSTIEPITPDLAEMLLQGNVRNRKISPRLVDSLARDMLSGNWILTHQGIALDKDGRLLDGQHRLTAVVKSGCTVKMVVTYNVLPEAFEVVDINNRPRSAADVFGMTHGTKNNTQVIAAIKVIDRISSEKVTADRYTFAEIDALYDRYGVDVSWAASKFASANSVRGAGLIAGVAYCRPCAPEVVERFVDGLVGMVGMDSSMAALRKAVERMSPCRNDGDRISLALVTMRCINAHERGEAIDKAYVTKGRQSAEEGKDSKGGLKIYKHWRARREKLGLPT